MALTCLVQFAVLYLLSWQIERNELTQFSKVFAPGDASVCHQADGDNRWTCSPAEAREAFNFGDLDLNGDGQWTHAEAAELSLNYVRNTLRPSNMPQLYKNFLGMTLQYASVRSSVQCLVGDEVEFYSSSRRQWVAGKLINITATSAETYVNVRETSGVQSWQEVNDVMLAKNLRPCEIPRCADLDFGIDAKGLKCRQMRFEPESCGGSHDDDDFVAAEVCCHCGGGLISTEHQTQPLNFSMDQLVSAPFWKCYNQAVGPRQKDPCLENFTSISKEIFQGEIAPFAPFCLIPDANLCANLQVRNLLPRMSFANTTAPMFLKIVDAADPLNTEELCKQAVKTYCKDLHAPQSPFYNRRREICGFKTVQIRGGKEIVQYTESLRYSGAIFGRNTFTYKAFLFLILFLWSLSSVSEFRDLLRWWIAMAFLPSHGPEEKGYLYLDDENVGEFKVIAILPMLRVLTLLLNLVPRTMISCFTVWVGFRYLLSVTSIPDLILNSLALTFLQHLDEMMFAAFGGQQSTTWIQNCKPIVGRSLKCMNFLLRKLRLPIGFLLCLPVIGLQIGFFVNDEARIARLAEAIQCLCNLEGDNCYAQEMLGARS